VPGRFDVRDLRRPLDVFTRDEVFLGTILKIVPADEQPPAAPQGAEQAQTEQAQKEPATPPSGRISGELLGPMPTAPLGNPGPAAQSAARGYRAEPDDAQALSAGSLVVGRWWGLLGRRTIRLDQILSLSLERVILKQTYEELNPGSRRRTPGRSRRGGH
jgi:hypothetical protein